LNVFGKLRSNDEVETELNIKITTLSLDRDLFLFNWIEYVVNIVIDEYGVGVKTAGLDKVVNHQVFEHLENKAVVPDDTSNHRRKSSEF